MASGENEFDTPDVEPEKSMIYRLQIGDPEKLVVSFSLSPKA